MSKLNRARYFRLEAQAWLSLAESAQDREFRGEAQNLATDCEAIASRIAGETEMIEVASTSMTVTHDFTPLAIITMVYNEAVNLPIWVKHYRRIAPSAKLFVIDHSSSDGSTAYLPGICRIPLPREHMDEIDRVSLLNSLQQGFLNYYRTVIYTDCDELLIPDPRLARTLEQYLLEENYEYAAPVGINITHIVDVEPPLDFSKPILRQRRFGHFRSVMCKPLIARVPLKWQPGFHSCDRPLNIDPNLYLLHIKTIDHDTSLLRQQCLRDVTWSAFGIESGHGVHHRYDDDQFVREYFLDPAAVLLQQGGPKEFRFDRELKLLHEKTVTKGESYHVPDFSGPVVEIPEMFRTTV